MTNRVSYAPEDFNRMCKQVERDRESKKLIFLLERVKRQIEAQRDPARSVESPKPPMAVIGGNSGRSQLPGRLAPSET